MNSSRLRKFQNLLASHGLNGYVVNSRVDVAYLTGFGVGGGRLLVGRKKACVFLSKMLLEQFKDTCGFCEAIASANHLEDCAAKAPEKTGFDPESETYFWGKFLKKRGFHDIPGFVASLREVKDGDEIALLRKSCRIAVAAFEQLKPKLRSGRTEISIKAELEYLMGKMGASGPSFDIIIGSGPNSAWPHHVTSERKLKNNEPLLLDFGCFYKGYASDITRTIFIGRPTAEYKKIYAIVENAHKAGLAAIRCGVSAFDADKTCRDIISAAGYGDTFIHGTGHGIGLEIHENPYLNTKSKAVLKAGMTVTVEPGIYLAGKFGVRLEDSVLVTKKGCEILTKGEMK